MRRWPAAIGLAFAIAASAAPKPERTPTTPTLADIASLERARDKKPDRADRRDALALAYYRFARAAFDRGEQASYTDYLERAMKEWIEALRLEPENQGRIDDALDSFYNARALQPGAPNAYTNIAETLIYAGRDKREVETWLSRGERMGANPAAAARNFTKAVRLDPEVVRVWNEAPVSKPIRTFADLTDYCCGSPACGPYLARACQKSELEVTQRQVPAETARRELLIEMERRRALGRIYKERRDLDIRVQKPEDGTPPAPPATPPPAPKESSQ